MNDGKSAKSNYRSNHTTPKESEDDLDDTIIDVQILPIEEEDEVKTPLKE